MRVEHRADVALLPIAGMPPDKLNDLWMETSRYRTRLLQIPGPFVEIYCQSHLESHLLRALTFDQTACIRAGSLSVHLGLPPSCIPTSVAFLVVGRHHRQSSRTSHLPSIN